MTDRDLQGKRFLVTGANTGIGRVTAVELARRGGFVVLACRSLERTQPVLDEIQALGAGGCVFVPLDLGDFESVRSCAELLLTDHQPLHVLVLNAGLAGQRGFTKSGFEIHFGVNHLGHFLLTLLLLDQQDPLPERIVVVASRAHTRTDALDLEHVEEKTRSVSGFPEYCNSKLANVLFAKELAARLEGRGTNVYSLHPGVVATDVWRRMPWPIRPIAKRFMISEEEGAATTIHCAASPDVADETGLYYNECKPEPTNPVVDTPGLAEMLWEKSLGWTGAPDFHP